MPRSSVALFNQLKFPPKKWAKKKENRSSCGKEILTIWTASQSFAAARKFLPNQPAEKVYKNTQTFAFVRKYIKKTY